VPNILTIQLARLDAEPAPLVVTYVAEAGTPSGAATALWAATGQDFHVLAQLYNFTGKQGQMLDLPLTGSSAKRLLVLGSGKADSQLAVWRDRGGSLMGKLLASKAKAASVVIDEASATPDAIGAFAAGLRLRHYKFDGYKSRSEDEAGRDLTVTIHVADTEAPASALNRHGAVAEGTILARNLISEPPNVLGPVEFAERLRGLADLGVSVEVVEPAALEELGMRAMLAVAQGSVRPARLVVMRWQGGDAGKAPLAVVGKGVVFDTGGISIKPGLNMENMKGDMSGAAAVAGLMHALAKRKAKADVIGICGIVENMPDGNAMRPGDIVKAMSGTTIEIVNTDAEGRLVLADCLWYVQQHFKPSAIIDLATLTGAMSVALGSDHAGLFSNDDALSSALSAAGGAVGEKLWRMPMSAHYDRLIDSQFADIKNSAGRPAGSITAAQFLGRFIKDTPWAHLDIAGVAFGTGSSEINTGWANGFGVALLDRLVADGYES
jgi:leucyl aminopeptidase